MEMMSTSIPSMIFGAPLWCDDENGMVVYSINDLLLDHTHTSRDDDDDHEERGEQFCQRISSRGMNLMMTDPQQLHQGKNKNNHVQEDHHSPELTTTTTSTATSRRGDRSARIRERKTAGSLQILSPIVVHHNKTAVKRKESRRSCFRHTTSAAGSTSTTSTLRASSTSCGPDELDSPRMAMSDKSTISKNACNKKVVRFSCDEIDEEEVVLPINTIRSLLRYRHNNNNKQHRTNS